jgi:hypothetical protein
VGTWLRFEGTSRSSLRAQVLGDGVSGQGEDTCECWIRWDQAVGIKGGTKRFERGRGRRLGRRGRRRGEYRRRHAVIIYLRDQRSHTLNHTKDQSQTSPLMRRRITYSPEATTLKSSSSPSPPPPRHPTRSPLRQYGRSRRVDSFRPSLGSILTLRWGVRTRSCLHGGPVGTSWVLEI